MAIVQKRRAGREADIREGDVILEVNDVDVNSVADLRSTLYGITVVD